MVDFGSIHSLPDTFFDLYTNLTIELIMNNKHSLITEFYSKENLLDVGLSDNDIITKLDNYITRIPQRNKLIGSVSSDLPIKNVVS